MHAIRYHFYATFLVLLVACWGCNRKEQQKGITIEQMSQPGGVGDSSAAALNLSKVMTRPSTVLLTAHAEHRLVTVYQLMQESKRDGGYLGTNRFYRSSEVDYNYEDDYPDDDEGHQSPRLNAWHGHYMPGIEALYGVNLLNISHYNMKTKERKDLFEHPIWVNNLYYPAFEKDTLNGRPVLRDYYMVSAYDEDTNKDSLVNYRDLRRLYLFDLDGKKRTQLIPPTYSVISSEFDAANDVMFVFASLDTNANGKRDTEEPVHVFWFSLKSPAPGERLY